MMLVWRIWSLLLETAKLVVDFEHLNVRSLAILLLLTGISEIAFVIQLLSIYAAHTLLSPWKHWSVGVVVQFMNLVPKEHCL